MERIEKSLVVISRQQDDIGDRIQTLDNKVDLLIAKIDECCEEEEHPPPRPSGVEIKQSIGGKPMAIVGVPVGGKAKFVALPVPSDTPFPDGTVHTWTASDPSVSLAPFDASDPSEDAVVASLPADSTLTTFDLTVSSQMPPDDSGTVPDPLTNTASIPVVKAPAPRPTGVVIDQAGMFK